MVPEKVETEVTPEKVATEKGGPEKVVPEEIVPEKVATETVAPEKKGREKEAMEPPPILPLVRQTRSLCPKCGTCVSEYGHRTCYRCAVVGTREHDYHKKNRVYKPKEQEAKAVTAVTAETEDKEFGWATVRRRKSPRVSSAPVLYCKYCKKMGDHEIGDCPTLSNRPCQYCFSDDIHDINDCPKLKAVRARAERWLSLSTCAHLTYKKETHRRLI